MLPPAVDPWSQEPGKPFDLRPCAQREHVEKTQRAAAPPAQHAAKLPAATTTTRA